MCGDKTEESPFFFEARPATARGRFNLFHKKSYARVQRSAAYSTTAQVGTAISDALEAYSSTSEMNTAIADAVDALNVGQYQDAAEVQFLIDQALLAYWDQSEVSSFVAGELANYATSASVSSSISSALIIRNLLLEAIVSGDAILGNQSTLRLRCDSWTKAVADGRFLRTNDLGPLDARYFVNSPGAEGGGIFNLVQTQSAVTVGPRASRTPAPLIANFNSLGQRVTDLENSPGVDPTADLTVNCLTATAFLDTPLLQSAAADLQIRNATTTSRAEDGHGDLHQQQLRVGHAGDHERPQARGTAGALFQFMSFNTTNGLANLAIEPNIGGSNDGEVIFGSGFVNLSDRALKENVRAIPEEELQQTFDAVEPQLYDRIGAGKDQIGFVAQDVQASGKLGATMCKTKNLDGRELMALDYQKLSVVLWGIVKKLQKRVEKLEKKKGRKDDSE
eukprot:s10027_g2.t1